MPTVITAAYSRVVAGNLCMVLWAILTRSVPYDPTHDFPRFPSNPRPTSALEAPANLRLLGQQQGCVSGTDQRAALTMIPNGPGGDGQLPLRGREEVKFLGFEEFSDHHKPQIPIQNGD